MAWSTPLTAVANAALTAAQWNASVRDNLLETAPAKATTAGRIIVTTGVNTIAERAVLEAYVSASETTVSTTYADLTTTGPAVTLTTGTRALVWMNCQISNSGASGSYASHAITGATASAAVDSTAIIADQPTGGGLPRYGTCDLRTGLTAGVNTFTMQYRVTAGTGTFQKRRIVVMGL